MGRADLLQVARKKMNCAGRRVGLFQAAGFAPFRRPPGRGASLGHPISAKVRGLSNAPTLFSLVFGLDARLRRRVFLPGSPDAGSGNLTHGRISEFL